MNTRKLNLITEATTAFPGVSINDAILLFLRNRYSSDQGLSDLIARYLYQPSIFAYNFDGVDDYGVLANRAINPDADIDIEWTQRGVPKNATFRAIVTQSFNSVSTTREFGLFVSDVGAIDFRVGGNFVISNVRDFRDDGTIRVLYVGSTLTVFFNGVQVDQKTMGRGGAREPTAATWICGRNGGGSLNNPMAGLVYNISINGALWAMDQRNQAIQPSTPAGNNMMLVNVTSDRWQEVPQ